MDNLTAQSASASSVLGGLSAQAQTSQENSTPTATTNVPGLFAPPIEPEYLLLQWVADSRVVHKRSNEYYSSLAVIVLLISLILFFAGQILLIVVLVAFLFLAYVLASVKAERVLNQITTYGIRIRGELYPWDKIFRFWLENNRGITEVHVETPSFLSGEIILLIDPVKDPKTDMTIEDITTVLKMYVAEGKPRPSFVTRWSRWLEEKFPLD